MSNFLNYTLRSEVKEVETLFVPPPANFGELRCHLLLTEVLVGVSLIRRVIVLVRVNAVRRNLRAERLIRL